MRKTPQPTTITTDHQSLTLPSPHPLSPPSSQTGRLMKTMLLGPTTKSLNSKSHQTAMTKSYHPQPKVGIGRKQTGRPSLRPSKNLPKQPKMCGLGSTNKEAKLTMKVQPTTSPKSYRCQPHYTSPKRSPRSTPNHGGPTR